ncbi:hypothetical protein XAB3213_270023 [Xanthomonas citri pv. bilvae]|nr:hypothetical protein XAB3213_270023 [Xanthomonas citri pv. bilvae]
MHPSTDGGNVHPTRCVLPPSRTLERVMYVEMRCVGRQRCGADAARRRLGWRQTKPRGAHSAPLAAKPGPQRTPCLDAPQDASHSPQRT